MITLAEFGDNKQIAVVGLTTSFNPVAVWMGLTLALAAISALGVWEGRTLLQHIPIALLHRICGILFLLLAIIAPLNYCPPKNLS